MIKAWNWVKQYDLWIYGAVFLGIAAWDFTHGAVVAGVVTAAVAVGVPLALRWARSGGELEVTVKSSDPEPLALAAGREAFGGNMEALELHRQENPGCSLCKMYGWDEL